MKFKVFRFNKVKSTNNTAIRIIKNYDYNYGMILQPEFLQLKKLEPHHYQIEQLIMYSQAIMKLVKIGQVLIQKNQ